MWKMR